LLAAGGIRGCYVACCILVDLAHECSFSQPVFFGVLYYAKAVDPEIGEPKTPCNMNRVLKGLGQQLNMNIHVERILVGLQQSEYMQLAPTMAKS
jgi:hypothetical protein